MGLPYGENFINLQPFLYDPPVWWTDRRW